MERDGAGERQGLVLGLSVLTLEAEEFTGPRSCCTEWASLASSGHRCHAQESSVPVWFLPRHFSPRDGMEE